MINRELIRLKVIQLIYAARQRDETDVTKIENELLVSLSKSYEMYLLMLKLIVEIVVLGQQKHQRTVERDQVLGFQATPASRFINNRFAQQLVENKALTDLLAKQKTSFTYDRVFVSKLYRQIMDSPLYSRYILAGDFSYEADKMFWRKAYREFLCQNEELDDLLEEDSIYWNDDKDVVDTFVLKTIKRFCEEAGSEQELLPDYESENDRTFAAILMKKAFENDAYHRDLIREHCRNWEIDRMALMDVIIAQVALAEILNFPTIPLRVSLNEYLEIARAYSTPKSLSYLNGLLDHIAKVLEEQNLITHK